MIWINTIWNIHLVIQFKPFIYVINFKYTLIRPLNNLTLTFRTSTPRAQSVKLVAPLDDKTQGQLTDLSAYADDAKLTDDEFVRRLASGQLTIQREASMWRREFNCTWTKGYKGRIRSMMVKACISKLHIFLINKFVY